MSDKLVCIWHGNCQDGFGAAWAVRHAHGEDNVEFYPGVYQEPPPDVTGRDVLMVDFAYKRPVIEEMAASARSILILDHHRSAFDEIGNLAKAASVPLSNGATAWVDEADLSKISDYTWSEAVHGGSIAYIGGAPDNKKFIYMHRLILDAEDGQNIDHCNRNTLDNRRINLRSATKQQNGANMDRGSAFKGVTARNDRWIAQITVDSQNRYLGMFDTAEAAALAYDIAAREAFGEYARCNFGQREPFPPNCTFIFDMQRSGAGLAWDYLNRGPRPVLIDHIEDRDLWRFKLPNTREISAALFSYPYSFPLWDSLMSDDVLPNLIIEGQAIDRKHKQDIANLLPVVKRAMVIGGVFMPVANLPLTLTSDAGHKMATDADGIAACYWDTPEGRVFSLRSTDDGPDCQGIAVKYGGGGHAHAAGFRMPLHWEGDPP